MKKTMLAILVTMTMAGLAGAQGMGMMGRGAGPMAGVETWGPGTAVTTEYKKTTGTLVLGQNLAPRFKADGVEYNLMLPRMASALLNVKDGDSLTLEGIVTTVKGTETPVLPTFHAQKAVVNGKEVVLVPVDDQGQARSMAGPMGGVRGGRGHRGR